MILPTIPNFGKLNSTQGNPEGYITKDGKWAAVPCGNEFMILCNGEQVHVSKTFDLAKEYIRKKLRQTPKKKKTLSSLESHFKD